MKNNRLFFLDFIRAIAILIIILFHYNTWSERLLSPSIAFPSVLNIAGSIGVSLFLMVSGSALAFSYKNDLNIKDFYKKRFLSIFPLFYVTYIFVVLSMLILRQIHLLIEGRNPISFLLTITGFDGFLFYKIRSFYLIGEWFLGLIIIMYLIFPLTRYLYSKNKILTLLLSAAISYKAYLCLNLDMFIFRFPPVRLFEFMAGMFFVSIYDENKKLSNIAMLLGSSIMIILIYSLKLSMVPLINFVLLGILSLIFLASLSSFLKKEIFLKPINFLSKYSYGAFLFHHIFIQKYIALIKGHAVSRNINIIFFIIALVIIYSASFVLTNITKWLLGKLRKQRTTPLADAS